MGGRRDAVLGRGSLEGLPDGRTRPHFWFWVATARLFARRSLFKRPVFDVCLSLPTSQLTFKQLTKHRGRRKKMGDSGFKKARVPDKQVTHAQESRVAS